MALGSRLRLEPDEAEPLLLYEDRTVRQSLTALLSGEAAYSIVNLRLARRPGLPTSMNPEPLVRITPHVFLDDVGKQLR